MAARTPEEIELDGLNGFGPSGHVPGRTVHYEDMDVEDRPYFSSDGNISRRSHDSGDSEESDYTAALPSRQIETLRYRSLGPTVKRKKTAAIQRAKTKTRRPTHIYNSWREDPEQLFDQIQGRWREEDNEDEEQDMADEVTTAQRIEELRGMTINLGIKIRLRDAMRKATIQRRQGTTRAGRSISCWTHLKYSSAIRWQHAKSSVSTAISSMGLWEGHLKAFAGHFGTDVTAYFLFLRWLFVANVLIGLLILVFLFIPQMLVTFAAYYYSGEKVVVKIPVDNKTEYDSSVANGVQFLTGKGVNDSSGFFTDKGMYYGDYDHRLVSSENSGISYYYNMQFAYLLAFAAYFLIFFLVIAVSVAKSYRTNFIESSDKFTFQYVLNILDGWDYMIDSANTAEMKQKNTFRDLREFCASKRLPEPEVSCLNSLMIFLFRAGAVIVMLMFITLCGFAVFVIFEYTQTNVTWKDLATPVIITAINSLVPFLFSVISSMLKFTYHKYVVYLTLIMTIVLYGVTLGVYFVKTMFPCSDEGILIVSTQQCSVPSCWETRLGEKAYAFVVIDFFFGLVITLISEVFYRLVAQFCCKKREEKKRDGGKTIYPQFDIARNTMAIIYNQFLLWLGIYYSPLLTVAVVIKLWIIFYIKRVTVMNACIPTTKPWRAAKMHTIFLGLLFVGFIVCIVFFAMALTVVKPSDTCGPFINLLFPIDLVTGETFGTNTLVMNIIISPGVVVGIIVVLCVVVHYVRVASAGRKTLISLLKIQITLESKDKAYLRHMLDEVQKHKSSRAGLPAPQCGTCPGACTCEINQRSSVDGAAPRGRRVFAKERSTTTLDSMLSSNTSAASFLGARSSGGVLSSREDLSKLNSEQF